PHGAPPPRRALQGARGLGRRRAAGATGLPQRRAEHGRHLRLIAVERGILRAMEFFETVTTLRAMRRLKPDPIPDAVLRQIMDAAICAPSGGNRQGWSFLVIRDAAKRARLGELYREAWSELMKTPYYRGASAAPPDSREGKMVASA